MMKSKSATLLVAFSIFTASNTFAQKETVILYNSQPVKVELSKKGQIKSFIGAVPGYMEGFDMSTSTLNTSASPEQPVIASTTTPIVQHEGYAIISNERIELDYRADFATLEKNTIDKLNAIAARLKSEPGTKILLTAHNANNEVSRLISNRLASATTYLGIKGIPQSRIQTEIQESSSLIDVIAVNYVN